jgi:hypothetical protein
MATYLLSWYNHALQFLETHLLTCPSRKYLHLQCPGCGLQRSFIALLRGDVRNSFILYPATIPIVLMLGFLLLHLKFRFRAGALLLRGIYLFCAVVILVQYVYKIASLIVP